jgi:hypothetical protein
MPVKNEWSTAKINLTVVNKKNHYFLKLFLVIFLADTVHGNDVALP